MARPGPGSTRRIAFVGSSAPRQCGIATFTRDLADAITTVATRTQILHVPVNDVPEGYDYPPRVCFELEEKDPASYRRAAVYLNINNVDVVSVQHEYGLYGGAAGSHLLLLMRDLRMPIVTTLHTVLRDPDESQRAALEEIIALSDKLIVMTVRSAAMLREVHAASAEKIEVIPHGIHDMPFIDPSYNKDKFGIAGKKVLLTFGLIGPGKGIEHMIEALPAIVARHPDTVYMVLGATHPTLKRNEGEMYRLGLQHLARERGVEGSVIFHNRFLTLDELTEFLGAADLYITPYANMAQAVSGTLAYAAGAGKAIVSTPYWHAEELLADEHGVLVPVADVSALADAVSALLDDPVRRDAMRKRAYLRTRSMTWPRVATAYLKAFFRARHSRLRAPRPGSEPITLEKSPELPVLRLDHLRRLTDDTGVIQHAVYCVPDYEKGYTTDDNARSLIFTVLAEETGAFATGDLWSLGSRYMSFLQYAYNPARERFRNLLRYDHRRWEREVGSEDCHGRALWALGTVVARWPREGIQEWAGQLVQRAVRPICSFTSPRAWAFALLGIREYLTRFSGDRLAEDVQRVLAERLLEIYRSTRTDEWSWFEDVLSYCNAKLPHALIATGRALDRDDLVETGLEALAWLARVQRLDAHFVPIGCHGFFPRGGERARFDQQPIEAHAMVSACIEAHQATGDGRWWEEARLAFEWFVGRNDLRSPVYDPGTGGCHDGLEPEKVNRNQGAESTLAFLLALVEMRLADGAIELPLDRKMAGAATASGVATVIETHPHPDTTLATP